MTTNLNDDEQIETDADESEQESTDAPRGLVPVTVYTDAIRDYLDAANWLVPADAPFRVHAQQVAASLDRQLTLKGEVQSALASSFDKCLVRLEARRPKPAPGEPQVPGQTSIFDYGQDS